MKHAGEAAVELTAPALATRMHGMRRVANPVALLAAVVVLAAGCAGRTTREPPNLSALKAELVRYQASGAYARELEVVAAEATRWIERRAGERKPGERLAVVLDVDETAISNWPNMQEDDFSYIPERWHAWVERAEAPAIAPVRETYRAALRSGVAVIFLTGRKERDRRATERNLRRAEMGEYAELIVATPPAGDRTWKNMAKFKTAMRRGLAEQGWTIIANIGDQESDLAGGFAEKTFKLPNPFYLTE